MPVQLTDAARRQAIKVGLTSNDIRHMLPKLIPSDHPMANRRYGNYLFLVANQQVLAIEHIDTCQIRKVRAVCRDCNNDGGYCNSCSSRGYEEMFPVDAVALGLTFTENEDEATDRNV